MNSPDLFYQNYSGLGGTVFGEAYNVLNGTKNFNIVSIEIRDKVDIKLFEEIHYRHNRLINTNTEKELCFFAKLDKIFYEENKKNYNIVYRKYKNGLSSDGDEITFCDGKKFDEVSDLRYTLDTKIVQLDRYLYVYDDGDNKIEEIKMVYLDTFLDIVADTMTMELKNHYEQEFEFNKNEIFFSMKEKIVDKLRPINKTLELDDYGTVYREMVEILGEEHLRLLKNDKELLDKEFEGIAQLMQWNAENSEIHEYSDIATYIRDNITNQEKGE